MKKVSLQNGLLSLTIILVIVLVVVYIKYLTIKNEKNYEEFYSGGNIIIKNNFYETSTEGPLFKSANKNNVGNKVGGVNLCIYEGDSSKITDIECISSGVFSNALVLPKARRESVCIDEECIDIKDAQFFIFR